MSGINRIYDRILSDAKVQASQRISAAEQEKSLKMQDARDKMDALQAKQLEAAGLESKALIARMVGNRELEGKKQVLYTKQQVLSEVFDKTHEQLLRMDSESLVQLYAKLAKASLSVGDNEIILNPEDKQQIGEKLIALLSKETNSETRVLLGDESIQADKGVIVKNGNIYSNSSFATLIKYKKQELEADVMNILFERGLQQ